ncbi:hypothetical protein AB0L41_49205 [Amycolatopsis mediterranei]
MISVISWSPRSFSPRTRGWSSLWVFGPLKLVVVPAHAGLTFCRLTVEE